MYFSKKYSFDYLATKGYLKKFELNNWKKHSRKLSPLMLAVDLGKVEIVKSLVAAGVNLKIRDEEKNIAILLAAKKGHEEMVNYLLAVGKVWWPRNIIRLNHAGVETADLLIELSNAFVGTLAGKWKINAPDFREPLKNNLKYDKKKNEREAKKYINELFNDGKWLEELEAESLNKEDLENFLPLIKKMDKYVSGKASKYSIRGKYRREQKNYNETFNGSIYNFEKEIKHKRDKALNLNAINAKLRPI